MAEFVNLFPIEHFSLTILVQAGNAAFRICPDNMSCQQRRITLVSFEVIEPAEAAAVHEKIKSLR